MDLDFCHGLSCTLTSALFLSYHDHLYPPLLCPPFFFSAPQIKESSVPTSNRSTPKPGLLLLERRLEPGVNDVLHVTYVQDAFKNAAAQQLM